MIQYDVNDKSGNFIKQQFFEASKVAKCCNHPNVVTQFGITMTGWQTFEYAGLGSVDRFLREEYQRRNGEIYWGGGWFLILENFDWPEIVSGQS